MSRCQRHLLAVLNDAAECAVCAAELGEQPVDERELEASILVEDFSAFFRAAWHVHEPSVPLVWGWPLETICQHLQRLVEDWARHQADRDFAQAMRDLLVTTPPGFAKSRLLSYLVPWAWLRWPNLRVIALSCNPRVAGRDNAYARDVIASPWYQQTFRPQWRVRDDADAKGSFVNTAGGFRNAMGFDARIVGERGDLIIVDDPHDPDEVGSEAIRNGVHDRWDNAISNRLNDLGSSIRVGIAQRTHEDDWSARRIAEGWAHLDMPMLYEPDRDCTTPLGKPDRRTVEGACLLPERFPPDVIAAERGKGERRWATLYQGRPAPAGGALIKLDEIRWHRRADRPDASATRAQRIKGCCTLPSVVTPTKFDVVVVAADLAGGKKTLKGDFNVIVAVGRAGSSFYLLEAWRERADFPVVQRKFREICDRYPKSRRVVESAAAGASLVTSLQAEITGLVAEPPQGDKISRVEATLRLWEAGNVHLDEYATDLDVLVAELTMFPNAAHDDFVDALTLALSTAEGEGTPVSTSALRKMIARKAAREEAERQAQPDPWAFLPKADAPKQAATAPATRPQPTLPAGSCTRCGPISDERVSAAVAKLGAAYHARQPCWPGCARCGKLLDRELGIPEPPGPQPIKSPFTGETVGYRRPPTLEQFYASQLQLYLHRDRCARCVGAADEDLAALATQPANLEETPTCSCGRCRHLTAESLSYRKPKRRLGLTVGPQDRRGRKK